MSRSGLFSDMESIGLAVILSEHTHPAPPGHPEAFERLSLVPSALERPEIHQITTALDISRYPIDLLHRVHDPEYINRLEQYDSPDIGYPDPDTYLCATSFAASCDVTWAVLSGVDAAFGVGPRVSLVLGRPPGHHAESDHAMGFCLVNHVAVAAQYAIDHYGCRHVAVVDFDVHHGNGTQHTFYDRSDVLFISTHQYPFYPGTGSHTEQGRDAGLGFTVNFPFPAGTGDQELVGLFDGEISDILDRFKPELIVVSAGFDGHQLDPLGGFMLTGQGYRHIGQALRMVADRCCGSRLVSVLEGGYHPEGNVNSIINYITGLA
ncbi:MAG: histone deacetylase, partial [candidate division Zixibacteria bacterium]|nr:histone deacetylase [candidate division Zixibacteria bacterium]